MIPMTVSFFVKRSKDRRTGLRNALRHAAVCPAPSHLECPTFRRLMKESATPAARKARKPKL